MRCAQRALLLRIIVRLGLKGLFVPLFVLLTWLSAALAMTRQARNAGGNRLARAVD